MPLVTLKWDDDNSDLTGFEVRASTDIKWFNDMDVKAVTEPTVKEYSEERQTNELYFMQVSAQRNGQVAVSNQLAVGHPASVLPPTTIAGLQHKIKDSRVDGMSPMSSGAYHDGPGLSVNDVSIISRDGKHYAFTDSVFELDLAARTTTEIIPSPLPGQVIWAGLDRRGNILVYIPGGSGVNGLWRFKPDAKTLTLVCAIDGSRQWGRMAVSMDAGGVGVLVLTGAYMPSAGPQPVGFIDLETYDYSEISVTLPSAGGYARAGWIGEIADNNIGSAVVYWPQDSTLALKIDVRMKTATVHDLGEEFPDSVSARGGVMVGGEMGVMKFIGNGIIYTLNPQTMTLTKANVNETLTDLDAGSGFITFAEQGVAAIYCPNGDYLFLGRGNARVLAVNSSWTGAKIYSVSFGGFFRLVNHKNVIYAISGTKIWTLKWDGAPILALPDSYYAGLSALSTGAAEQ
ncbi:hypothetical protein phiA034_gene0018 [Aeromonas phage phiA034]|uniref:Uncharacterized protein n=1 Tax=Aeromonas phage phiA034 TaxID=2985287 RepID=A0AAF0C149_9CAUD|nr:hypothetical protein phiA034_gene0018 [Aeromonas phage phiA034]